LDFNKQTLNIAKQNIDNLKIDATILYQDVLNVKKTATLIQNTDIVISNPPYISQIEYDNLESQVINYEPKMALTDCFDGLNFYKSILESCNLAIKKPRFLLFEIGSSQSKDICKLTNYKTKVIKDLAGRDRVIIVDFYI
jgi:release factor glutamine methyltransferase